MAKPAAPNSRPAISVARSPKPVDGGLDQPALDDAGGDADGGQREPHGRVVPAVAVAGVEHGHRRQHDVGQVVEERHAGQAEQLGVARSSCSEPTGLARAQLKAMRCSRGSDSGSTK